MPCLVTPKLPAPELPAPLSIDLSLTPPDISAGFCCKMPIPPIPVPPVAISASLLAPVVAALNGYIQTAVEYISSIPFNCPLDDDEEEDEE
jgi:hypothetical protein